MSMLDDSNLQSESSLRESARRKVNALIQRESLLYLGDGLEKNPFIPDSFDGR